VCSERYRHVLTWLSAVNYTTLRVWIIARRTCFLRSMEVDIGWPTVCHVQAGLCLLCVLSWALILVEGLGLRTGIETIASCPSRHMGLSRFPSADAEISKVRTRVKWLPGKTMFFG
jgi:hypothetical protein